MADRPPLEERDEQDIPETIGQALDLAVSGGASTLLLAAALLANARGRNMVPTDLFIAALAIGMRRPTASSLDPSSSVGLSSSSSLVPPADPSAADAWLYDWFDAGGKAQAVNSLVQREAANAFPVPPPRHSNQFTRDAQNATVKLRLNDQVRSLLARASSIAWQTLGDSRFGVRHVVAALTLPDSSGCNASIASLAREQFGVEVSAAGTFIVERAERSGSREEAEGWRRILSNPPPSPSLAPPHSPPPSPGSVSRAAEAAPDPSVEAVAADLSVMTLSGFTSDALAAGKTDPLGINPDVRAFARLICLEEATPPLSICLFGEWGSGKSTFMERLQREITRLTAPKPARTEPKPARTVPASDPVSAEEPKFVDNIVQIKFNAWHFADASLWASLTAVFFDQLRRGGYDGGRASDYQALIGEVAGKVRSLEASAANEMAKVTDAKRKSDAAHKALDTAEKQLAANDLTLAWTQLQSDFEKIRADNADKLKEVGRRVYRDDLAADTKAFAAAVAEAASISGRIALIGRVLIAGGWPTAFGVLAIVLVAAAGMGFHAMDTTDAASWFQRSAAFGAAAFAALGALWQAFKAAQPIFEGAWKYAKAVEDSRAKLTQEVETKRTEANQAAELLKAAEAGLATARAPLSVYLDGVPNDSPSTILRYFLFEDGDVRDYDKQVGIVSRARRSFEKLNSIVSTTRLGRRAAEKSDRGEPLTAEEKAALAHRRASSSASAGELRVPDRIVLYIDDLDRCTHDQVYAVLQAIHLLLAFELFVVVVGVDVRWIEGAVAKHFEADTAKADEQEQPAVTAILRRKRAIDYLEKIFQIPFWLERLNTGRGAAADGGSYGAYVRELLKGNERATPGPGGNIFKSLLPPTRRLPHSVTPLRDDDVPAELNEADIAASLAEAGAPAEDEFGAVDAALASLKLEKAEIDFLAGPEIGAIASKSPRAVKRLINIYRIVRARLSDAELDAFLGRAGKPPRYPIAALLAAIETGQPVELVEALYPALALLPQDEALNLIWTTMDKLDPKKFKDAAGALLRARTAAPALGPALAEVDRLCGKDGASAAPSSRWRGSFGGIPSTAMTKARWL